MLNANGLWTSESVKLIFMIFVIERDWQKGVSIRRNVSVDFCSKEKRVGDIVLSSLSGKYSAQNLEGKILFFIFAARMYKR